MTSFIGWALVGAAALLPLNSIVNARISRSMQPARLELARRGEALLAAPNLSEDTRDSIRFMLRTAFGLRFMLCAVFTITPMVAVAALCSRRVRDRLTKNRASGPKEAREEYRSIDALHTAIMRANNPVLVAVIEIWFVIWLIPALSVARLFDHSSPPASELSEDALVRYLDRRSARLAYA